MADLIKYEPQQVSLAPRNMTEAMDFAKMIAQSDMVPKDYRGKPANALLAMQWGFEVGLAPMQALQNIAVINGRPSIYGDAMLALVRGSGQLEFIKEDFNTELATCTIKRRGEAEPVTRTFSIEDAKRAGLWGKGGPWQQYPQRMLQMRARGSALRDVFPDVLRGMYVAEEAQDIPPDNEPPKRQQRASQQQDQIVDAEIVEDQPALVADALTGLKAQIWALAKQQYPDMDKAGLLEVVNGSSKTVCGCSADSLTAAKALELLKFFEQGQVQRAPESSPRINHEQQEQLLYEGHCAGMDKTQLHDWLAGYGYSWHTLTQAQYTDVMEMLAVMIETDSTEEVAAGV